MKSTRVFNILAGVACLVLLLAGSPAGPLQAQTRRVTGDFTHASIAEVRDARGEVVLRGEFVTGREDEDEDQEEDDDPNAIERSAALLATGSDADATGEAEVEVEGSKQEIEFSVEHVEPGATFTFLIDGVEVGTKRANRRGRVELELAVPIPKSGSQGE
jgi:hypothetical protein